jgi:hypothetical protein
MTEHRSFYLDSKQNDFAEFSEIDHSDIPFVDPANDNEPTKARLSARNRALMRRLMPTFALFEASLSTDGH